MPKSPYCTLGEAINWLAHQERRAPGEDDALAAELDEVDTLNQDRKNKIKAARDGAMYQIVNAAAQGDPSGTVAQDIATRREEGGRELLAHLRSGKIKAWGNPVGHWGDWSIKSRTDRQPLITTDDWRDLSIQDGGGVPKVVGMATGKVAFENVRVDREAVFGELTESEAQRQLKAQAEDRRRGGKISGKQRAANAKAEGEGRWAIYVRVRRSNATLSHTRALHFVAEETGLGPSYLGKHMKKAEGERRLAVAKRNAAPS